MNESSFLGFFAKCGKVGFFSGVYGLYGGFLKWWYQTAIGFPTKNDHFGVFWGYYHFRKHPYTTMARSEMTPGSKVSGHSGYSYSPFFFGCWVGVM